LLIHPSHRKYDESRRMPYLVMIDRLKGFLRNEKQPVALFVIGHSFRDEHLNATIVESLRANPSAACFAFQYEDLSVYAAAATLAKSDANLTILGRDAAIIRRREAKWVARPGTELIAIDIAFELSKPAGSGVSSGAAAGPTTNDDTDKPRPCRFLLGDFGRFGIFLDDFGRKVESEAVR